MNLIQSVIEFPKGLGQPDPPAKASGQGQNTFASALQAQQGGNPEATAKAQTGLSGCPRNQDSKGKKPGQSWASGTAAVELTIAPVLTEVAKRGLRAVANKAGIASTRSPNDVKANRGDNAAKPLLVIPATSPRTSCTESESRSIAVTCDAGTPTERPKQSFSGKLPASYPEPTVSAGAAAIGLAGIDIPLRVSPLTAFVSPAALPSPSVPRTGVDVHSAAGTTKSDAQAEPSTASVTGQLIAQQLSPGPGPGDSQFSGLDPSSAMQFAAQQCDPGMHATSQATPQPIAATPLDQPLSDEIPPNQAELAVATLSTERHFTVPPPSLHDAISPARLSATLQKSSPETDLTAKSGRPHMPPHAITATPIVPAHADAAIAQRVAHGQENKSASSKQASGGSWDAERPNSPEISNMSSLANGPSRTPFARAAAQAVPPNPIAPDPGKDPVEPRLSSDQEGRPTTTPDVSTKPIPTVTLQAAPPVATTAVQAQDRAAPEPTGTTATNLITSALKPQQVAEAPVSGAGTEASPVPHRTDPPLPGEAGTAGVMTARIVEGISQSEMHVGLRTQAFGAVNLHTAVRDTQLGLAVSSERGDLRSFFSPEVPALQVVLRQHDLHLETIRFIESGNPASTSSGGADSHARSFGQGHRSMPEPPLSDTTEDDSAVQDISLEIPARLSVHA